MRRWEKLCQPIYGIYAQVGNLNIYKYSVP
jgi:hypothetical protein